MYHKMGKVKLLHFKSISVRDYNLLFGEFRGALVHVSSLEDRYRKAVASTAIQSELRSQLSNALGLR